jgi:TorA maturation chaperone TorD
MPDSLLDCREARAGDLQRAETCIDLSAPKSEAYATWQEAEARANLYRFLSTAYLQPPQGDLVRQILDEDFLSSLCTLFSDRALATLRSLPAMADPEKDLPSLRQEYMDLFAVPTGRYVTPFEDVYRGKTPDGTPERGPLMGERAIAVRRLYRAAGAEMDSECKELPTHIGVELAFMGFLCEQQAAALRAGLQAAAVESETSASANWLGYRRLQIIFLQRHLNDWFPRLSEVIQTYATTPLYRGLALLTEDFLAWDAACLAAETPFDRDAAPQTSDGLQ